MDMENTVRAVIVPVDESSYEIYLERDETGGVLKPMQEAVDGYVECVRWVFGDALDVWVNDEGIFNCEPNRAVYAQDKHVGVLCSEFDRERKPVEKNDLITVLFGQMVVLGADLETGETRSLTDAEVERVKKTFDTAHSIGSGKREIMDFQLHNKFRPGVPWNVHREFEPELDHDPASIARRAAEVLGAGDGVGHDGTSKTR
jgi:hypothetical protein